MASYKIIQDIEADDKLLGPLTLRQFIYAGIGALFLYLSYIALIRHADFLLVLFIPVVAIALFFAFPWKLNQPTEVWALAKIRFLFLPKNRKWDQNSVKSIVVVTAPEKIVTDYTKGLTAKEIDSRLKSLAKTIDTRGWAIKNVNNLADLTQPAGLQNKESDRLIGITVTPTVTSSPDVKAADDILDVQNNSIAQHVERELNKYTAGQRKNLINSLGVNKQSASPTAKPTANNSDWFLSGPSVKTTNTPATTTAPKIHGFHDPKPTAAVPVAAPKTPVSAPKTPMTETSYADILNLASNNDLNIATIARQVNTKQASSSQDEVVISLH